MGEHTPGPWRVVNNDAVPTEGDDGLRFLTIRAGETFRSPYDQMVSGYIDCGGIEIAMVQFGPREANALLMAAAPAMRDVLAGFIASLTDNGKNRRGSLSINHDDLTALIAKAQAALASATIAHGKREDDRG